MSDDLTGTLKTFGFWHFPDFGRSVFGHSLCSSFYLQYDKKFVNMQLVSILCQILEPSHPFLLIGKSELFVIDFQSRKQHTTTHHGGAGPLKTERGRQLVNDNLSLDSMSTCSR